MKKYEAPVVEMVSFTEEIMLGGILGFSRVEDGGEDLEPRP